MGTRLWAGMLVGGATLFAGATQAPAATVALTEVYAEEGHCNGCGPYLGVLVDVVAAPGEANRLTATRVGDRVVLADAGAALTLAAPAAPTTTVATTAPCAVVDAHTVDCPRALTLGMRLGDGGDVVTIGDGVGVVALDGGAGDDVLTAAGGDDALAGGAGRDELHGGAGADTLGGVEPAASPDTLDGGPGLDTVTYEGSAGALRVDLRAQAASGASIGSDTLGAIENAHGGAGADALTGDGGPNVLAGDDGDDLLRGGPGDDALYGGSPGSQTSPAPDRLDGGPGNDLIDLSFASIDDDDIYSELNFAADGRADRVRCGSGADRVGYGDAHDPLPPTCERVSWGDVDALYTPILDLSTLRAGRRSITLSTTELFGRPLLRAANGRHRALSTRAAKLTTGAAGTRVRFPLTPAERTLTARRRPTTIRIEDLADRQGTTGSLAVVVGG